MKIAIVFYGQPRNYKEGYESIQKFLRKQINLSIDFFYHCWTLEQSGKIYDASPWRTITKETLTFQEDVIIDLQMLYKPKKWLLEAAIQEIDETPLQNTLAYKNIIANERKRVNVKNVISQMISRTRARNLVNEYIAETNTVYDFIIMSRFDIKYTPENLLLNELDPKKIYVSNAHKPRRIFPDNFMIIPPKIFCQWMAIQDYLPAVLNSAELDKQLRGLKEKLELNPEEILLATYLWHFGSLQNIVTHPAIKCGI